jgi:hypothetical protein
MIRRMVALEATVPVERVYSPAASTRKRVKSA